MTEPVDQEIEAIKAVLAALLPLSEKARVSVLEYVSKRLDLAPQQTPGSRVSTMMPGTPIPPTASQKALHIKDFKEQKRPRSANEMAAVIGYYLANLAPEGQRKETINQRDVETYFKIASFPLPQQVRATLHNAKTAGYFDLVGEGEYRLNAVGHNLVAHSMPRGGLEKTSPRTSVGQKRRPKPKRSKA